MMIMQHQRCSPFAPSLLIVVKQRCQCSITFKLTSCGRSLTEKQGYEHHNLVLSPLALRRKIAMFGVLYRCSRNTAPAPLQTLFLANNMNDPAPTARNSPANVVSRCFYREGYHLQSMKFMSFKVEISSSLLIFLVLCCKFRDPSAYGWARRLFLAKKDLLSFCLRQCVEHRMFPTAEKKQMVVKALKNVGTED
jgi:hypothetical protein